VLLYCRSAIKINGVRGSEGESESAQYSGIRPMISPRRLIPHYERVSDPHCARIA